MLQVGSPSARRQAQQPGASVNFQVPEIEVRMVNAAALEEYEIWFGLASIFAAATIGFVVAYIQSIHEAQQLGNGRGQVIAEHPAARQRTGCVRLAETSG
jgi:hypothetical protein